MAYVNFNRTTNKTSAISGEMNTIYFPTDAASIIMNGKEYGVTDISGKQDVLTAGSNIQINGTTISATDTIYDDTALSGRVSTIEGEIPAQVSSSNQLADKNFVNSSIATSTATFKGTYSNVASLASVTADDNDYAFVTSTDAAGNTLYNRYKYDGTQWLFEYSLNNSGFTSNQWATINSGATAQSVSDTASHLVDTTVHVTTADKTKWDAAEPNVQSDWSQSDNTKDDFIKNKPTIPIVPTNVSAFTNDAGYLTQHQDITGKEDKSNKVTSLSNSSTDTQYPSAKCVYDLLPDEDEVNALINGVDTSANYIEFEIEEVVE